MHLPSPEELPETKARARKRYTLGVCASSLSRRASRNKSKGQEEIYTWCLCIFPHQKSCQKQKQGPGRDTHLVPVYLPSPEELPETKARARKRYTLGVCVSSLSRRASRNKSKGQEEIHTWCLCIFPHHKSFQKQKQGPGRVHTRWQLQSSSFFSSITNAHTVKLKV